MFDTAPRLRFAMQTLVLMLLQGASPSDAERRGWGVEGLRGELVGSISGTVVDGQTGAFLPDAAVNLFWHPAPGRGAGMSDDGLPQTTKYSTRSLGDGSFSISRLPAGNYAVDVALPGYLTSGASAVDRVVSILSAAPKSLSVQLYPDARIHGYVFDASGRAVRDAKVRAFVDLQGCLREAASGKTDAGGEFSVGGLARGSYVLLVEPSESLADMAPSFYPSSPTVDGAVRIETRQGERVSAVRILLPCDPAYRVRGRVDDFQGILANRSAIVRLVPRSNQRMDLTALARSVPLDTDQTFHFVGVPSGLYELQLVGGASARRVLTTQFVVVGSSDVVDVALRPATPISLRGQVTTGSTGGSLASILVVLLAVSPATGSTGAVEARAGHDGRFVARGLEPIRYALRVQADSDLYLQRVRWGGGEVTGPILDLTGGAWGNLEIGLLDGAARITGTVLGPDVSAKHSLPTRVAILYPAGERPEPWNLRVASVDGGKFGFSGLQPGKYAVFVTERFDPDLYSNPAFRSQIAADMRLVALRRYDHRKLNLRLIDAGRVATAVRQAGLAGYGH